MIACVSNQEDAPFTVSTKSFEVDSGRRAARIHTRKVLRACQLPNEDGATSLLTKLSALPSRREDWQSFVQSSLPILDVITHIYEKRSLRRNRFASYMKRDQALDNLCKRIAGGVLPRWANGTRYKSSQDDVLVAFGAANACSTRFGYAAAPQERLRRRLAKLHGARVFLVDEFRTSQMCCRCHNRLDKVTVQNMVKGQLKRVQPHGLRRCPTCHNEKDAPLYCHRDVNAARNILNCFLAEAAGGQRPKAFSRLSHPSSSSCSNEQELGLAVRPPLPEERPSKRAVGAARPRLQRA